jgi:Fe-S-cluster-containing dehydrogenase component
MACKIGNGLADDAWWVTVRTLGSGEGIDRPAGTYPNLSMGWLPVWSESCVFCAGRTRDGKQPYCVYNCPTEALVFGEEAAAAEIAQLRAAGFRVFELPVWENQKPGITYASRK